MTKSISWKERLPGLLINLGTIIIVAIMLFVNNASARPTQTQFTQSYSDGLLSYQGVLQDSHGNPINGLYDMVFAMYNSATDTEPLWTEERSGINAVLVQNGMFDVTLGGLNPIPNVVWSETDLFLGISVGNDNEMSPREKLSIVPRAASAETAQLALSVPYGSITSDQVADGSINLVDIGEQPYYFYGSFATPTEWMADVIFNGNYSRFCEAIGREYSRAETLTAHYTEFPGHNRGKGNGFFYLDWYYLGSKYNEADIHVYGSGDPDDFYNVWQYKGNQYSNTMDMWTFERAAIIWCR